MSNGQDTSAFTPERDTVLENCIESVASGDREALGRLYEETHAAVFGYALSIVRNRQDAEDVLQEVFVKIWQSAPGYRPMGKPLAWIFTITRSIALMELRRKGRSEPVDGEGWKEMFADNPMVNTEDALLLESLMELLEDEERDIVLLHAVAGFKHRESAELLDLSLSAVLSKYSRALKKLRQALEVQ